MSIEENKALFRRWLDDVVNDNDYSAIDELLAPDYVSHFRTRRPSIATTARPGRAVRRGVPGLEGADPRRHRRGRQRRDPRDRKA